MVFIVLVYALNFGDLSWQVVAITVFCLLVIAFYAFFAPFIGGKIWEFVLIGTYTPVVSEFLSSPRIEAKFVSLVYSTEKRVSWTKDLDFDEWKSILVAWP